MSDNFVVFSPKEVRELGELVLRLKQALMMHKARIQKLSDANDELEAEVSHLRLELALAEATKVDA